MKRPFSLSRLYKQAGFTLIELLVVMGIIAILAAVLFPAAAGAINAAKRARASAIASNIQTAVLAYNTEYSIYPVATSSGTATDTLIQDTAATDGNSWATLDYILCGNIHPSTGSATPTLTGSTNPSNTRSIVFLNLKSSDVFTAANTTGITDAPKNPLPTSAAANIYFNIAMDSDYDGVLGTTSPTSGVMPNFSTSTTGSIVTNPSGTSTAGVAVWANCNGSTTQNPSFYVHTY